jgi:hypothetical protein
MWRRLTTRIGSVRIGSAFLNLVSRQKLSRKIATRKKKNKLKILNFPVPLIFDGDDRARDFYSQNGNPPKKNFENYIYKPQAARLAPFETFCVPQMPRNLDCINSNKEQLQKPRIVVPGGPDINGQSLESLQFQMQQHHYIILGHNEEIQKYWFPSSPDVLNAVITFEKLFKFVCFDPLDPGKSFKKMSENEVPKTARGKKELAKSRYKPIQRGIEMFRLFGISHHNLLVFRDFLISQLGDINNLYSLSHNKFNYTATYLIPISWVSQDPTKFINNSVVQYYERPGVLPKRRHHDTLAELDSTIYPLLLGPRNYNSVHPKPENSVTNQIFLRNLDVSLKQAKPANYQVEQYFLEVAIHSAPEAHWQNNNLVCNSKGWDWRPEIYGQLVTVVPHRYDKLNPIQQSCIQRRTVNKVAQAGP